MPVTKKPRVAKASEKLYSIKLLLLNWNEIQTHCAEAIAKYTQVYDDDSDILIKNSFIDADTDIRSITRSKQRTEILITHVYKMIKKWETSYANTYDERLKRRIIRGFYLNEPWKSLHKIAKEENKPYDVIKKQRDKALQELSALIFGADGLLKVDGAVYLHNFVHTFEETLGSGGFRRSV